MRNCQNCGAGWDHSGAACLYCGTVYQVPEPARAEEITQSPAPVATVPFSVALADAMQRAVLVCKLTGLLAISWLWCGTQLTLMLAAAVGAVLLLVFVAAALRSCASAV